MASAATWDQKRETLTTYFDRTAAGAWEALTSDAPVSRIRATVRAGRETMRELILSRLPADMAGRSLLDAGCGTGALALEAAARWAMVTAIDVSPRMIEIARDRAGGAAVTWRVGDMLDASLGRFDHVVCMDSLIHYRQSDILTALAGLAARTDRSIVFTVAPSTPLLSVMHRIGKLFPRADRAPAIEPVAPARLAAAIAADPRLAGWRVAASERVTSGFYMSQMIELAKMPKGR